MNRRTRPPRLAFRLLEGAFSLAFLGMVVHHVGGHDFRPLAVLCAPILILYYGLSSLLFVRGKSLADGPWQVRSMHAAERAMQATVWHVLGIVTGLSMYGLLGYVEGPLGMGPVTAPAILVLFAAPFAFMQLGLLSFLRAIWLLAPHLTKVMSAHDVRRRVVPAAKPAAACAMR